MHQALHGYTVVARYDVIARRFEAIRRHKERLATVVGEHEVTRITYRTYAQMAHAHD